MKKITGIMLVLCFMLSLVLPASAANVADGAKDGATTGIVTEIIGDVRVQVLSPSLVRLEEKGPKGFEDRETFHIVNRTDWDGDIVTRADEGDAVTLTTSTSKIVLPKNAKSLDNVKIYNLAGTEIYEYFQIDSNKQDLPAFNERVDAWAIADTPRIVAAEWGFNIQPDDNTYSRETNGWDLDNDAEDIFVFLPENDHRQLRKDFVNLTGRSEMLPLTAFGSWDSRWYAYSEETGLQQIDDYHSRDLPLDVLVVDTDWRAVGATGGAGYDIATNYFPDMERFLSRAHEKNVSIVFNDHPEPTKTNGFSNNVLAEDEVVYRQTNLTNLLKMGLDAWWYDRNWSVTVKPLDGFTHEVMGMATYAAAQHNIYPDRRLFLMSNVDGDYNGLIGGISNIAAHRYSIEWTGDTSGYQETIWQEIKAALTFGEAAALPYVSTDVCAHQTLSPWITDTEYVRWIQFGVLSPIFRPHVTGNDTGRMPWLRGERITDIYRDYANLRYRLLPVFYQLSHENYETGMPMLRPMTANYPGYDGADTDDQYLLGEDILVAPVIAGGRYTAIPQEYLTTPDGQPGVKAEYFKNTALTGTPTLTKTESSIDFDWGNNAPNSSVGSDNFGIRFTGNFTVPEEADSCLTLLSDDGCRLYVDDELLINSWKGQEANFITEKLFKAGTTHSFKLEYYEGTGNARVRLGLVGASETSEERSVWIPEGCWINTITGEEVYGPTTIDISCGLEDMPIFVKSGAVIPLADETLTTADSNWKHLTLDYYPSMTAEDTSEIYEDDTESNKYEDGEFRTTALTAGYDAKRGSTTLTIGAAQGDFSGELAFDSRDWTVRVHQPASWGQLTGVTDEKGNALEFEKIAADTSAMPLMTEGGAADGTVYEIQLTADVDKTQKLYFTFDNMKSDADKRGDELPAHIGTDSGAVVDREINIADAPDSVNLSKEGNIDWIYAGYNSDGTITRKSDKYEYIRFENTEDIRRMTDYKTAFSWNSSTDGGAVSNLHNGLYTEMFDDPYEFSVTAVEGEQILTLYLGGYNSYGRLEISDGSPSRADTYIFNNGGSSYYKKVEIKFSAKQDTLLNIKYTCISGANVVFTGATLRQELSSQSDPVEVKRTVTVSENMPAGVNLTAEGTGDWVSGKRVNGSVTRKSGVYPAVELTSPEVKDMYDYRTAFSWSDGTNGSISRTNDGIYHWGNGDFVITVPVTDKEETLKLYLGGWRSTSKLEIYDETGKEVNSYEFSNPSDSYYRVVTVTLSADKPSKLYAKYSKVGGGDGNTVFAAASFTGTGVDTSADVTPVFSDENRLYLSSGNYASGTWTSKPVTIGVSAAFPDKVRKYQVNSGSGWTDMDENYIRITDNCDRTYSFRYLGKDGKYSAVRRVEVKIDNKEPVLNVIKKNSGDNVVYSYSLTAGDSGAKVYYRTDGGRWIPFTGTLSAEADSGELYRFKAVSTTGVETLTVALDTAPPSFIPGDVDNNGTVNVSDIMTLKNLIMSGSWDDGQLLRGDMDGNNQLNVSDMLSIKSFIMNS